MTLIVIGCDPGPCTGLAVLRYPGKPSVFQCDADSARDLFWYLKTEGLGTDGWRADVVLAGEEFRAGRGPGARMSTGKVTRDLITELDALGKWHWRAAGQVKPWSTDRRLEAAGLLKLTEGNTHSRDACRHALYAAVWDGGMPDPLSRKART